MKTRYLIVIFGLILIAVAFEILIFRSPIGEHSRLEKGIQSVGIFVALLAAVVALAVADPKKKSVKISIEKPYIINKEKEEYKKDEIDNNVKAYYKVFPVTSYRVHFKMKNISGFDLKNPVFTFNKLPIEKQRPYSETKDNIYSTRCFTFSIVRPDRKAHFLEVDKKYLISLDGLPYWNKDNDIDLWIRMVINAENEEFKVDVSVNCEKADGWSEEVTIKPKELLNSISKINPA